MERDVEKRLNGFSESVEDLWIEAIDFLDELPPEYRDYWTDRVAFPLVQISHNVSMLQEVFYGPDFGVGNPLSEED